MLGEKIRYTRPMQTSRIIAMVLRRALRGIAIPDARGRNGAGLELLRGGYAKCIVNMVDRLS